MLLRLRLRLLGGAAVDPVARHERNSTQVVPEALANGLDVGLLQAPVEVEAPQLASIVRRPAPNGNSSVSSKRDTTRAGGR